MRGILAKLARVDLDGLIAPVLLAAGAEHLWSGSALFVLGAALYLPLLIDAMRGRA